jgi:hypothetical protein
MIGAPEWKVEAIAAPEAGYFDMNCIGTVSGTFPAE